MAYCLLWPCGSSIKTPFKIQERIFLLYYYRFFHFERLAHSCYRYAQRSVDYLTTFILYIMSARDWIPIPLHWLYIDDFIKFCKIIDDKCQSRGLKCYWVCRVCAFCIANCLALLRCKWNVWKTTVLNPWCSAPLSIYGKIKCGCQWKFEYVTVIFTFHF